MTVIWPQPRNITAVKAFVALCSYYRLHVARFSELAQPLRALTKKHTVFRWTDLQQPSFQALKAALVNAPLRSSTLED